MKIKTQFHTVEKFLLKPVALDDILLKVRSGTMAKDKRFEIHLEMKRVFGKKSCERSQSGLLRTSAIVMSRTLKNATWIVAWLH